ISGAGGSGGVLGNNLKVTAIVPADGAANVDPFQEIELTFNQAVNGTTVTIQTDDGDCTESVQVSCDDFTSCLGGTVDLDTADTHAFVTVSSGLDDGATCKVKVTTDAKATVGGGGLASDYVSGGFDTADVTTGSCAEDPAIVISQIYPGGGLSK